MSSIFDRIKFQIDRGRSGKNQGISFNLPKLESIIDGVTGQTYVLIMGASGSGN